jgi:hypothetical protein
MYNDKSDISSISNFQSDIISNNIGTNNDTTISYLDPMVETKNDEFIIYNSKNDMNNVNIYRYKFTEEVVLELNTFSKIHQYDDRQTFKEAWKVWTEENNEMVEKEVRRLKDLEYEGDVLDKMFKSARYYFRKKSTDVKTPKKRGVYISLQKELLENMDTHIYKTYHDFKPSDGFNDFCLKYQEILKQEIKRLIELKITNLDEIKNKMKKTYKNRYFICLKKKV